MSDTPGRNRQQLKPIVLDLLRSGAHFGHPVHLWNPKMAPYIFTSRGNQHVIDLAITADALLAARSKAREVAAHGGKVVFVGTKRQAQKPVEDAARECNMHYINIRWLGGTLTNWQTISERIRYLNEREAQYEAGEFNALNKKERLFIKKEIDKLNRRLGGIKDLESPPDLIFVVDTNVENLAVKEANRTDIPIMAMVDTNCDPDPIDYVIPSNDDTQRPIRYITGVIANAIKEGSEQHLKDLVANQEDQGREPELPELEEEYVPEGVTELDAEDLLGPSVLKRIAEEESEEPPAESEEAASD